MTTLREAAQQALEALNSFLSDDLRLYQAANVYDALKAALAQETLDAAYQQWLQESHAPALKRTDSQGAFAAGWRAALAQEQAEPVAGIIESEIKGNSHQTLDDAMRLPRAMAQAYENGYKAGVAAEREACAKLCEARFVGDLTREDMEARRCAAAIRARGEMP